MNTHGPPKRAGAMLPAPFPKLGLWTAYLIAKLLANTLGWPFWFAEQWRGKLADELERRRT
jgi:hypothetical protein